MSFGWRRHANGVALFDSQRAEAKPAGVPACTKACWDIPAHQQELSHGFASIGDETSEEVQARAAAFAYTCGIIAATAADVVRRCNRPAIESISKFVHARLATPATDGTVPCSIMYPFLGIEDSAALTTATVTHLRESCSSLVVEMRQDDVKDESTAFHRLQGKLIDADIQDRVSRATACLPGAGLLPTSAIAAAMTAELVPELRKLVNRANPMSFLKDWWQNRLEALRTMPESTPTLDASVVVVIHDIELAHPEVVQSVTRFLGFCTASSECFPRLFVVLASCTSRVRLFRHLTRRVTDLLEVHEVRFEKPHAIIGMLVSRLQVYGLCPMFLPQSLLGEVQELALMNNLGLGYFCHILRCAANLHFGQYSSLSKSANTALMKFLVLPAEMIAAIGLEERGRSVCCASDYLETPLWAVCSRMASFLRAHHLESIQGLPSYKLFCAGARTPSAAIRAAVREDDLNFTCAQKLGDSAANNSVSTYAAHLIPENGPATAQLATWVYRKDVKKEVASIHASFIPFGVPRGMLPIYRGDDEVCDPCEPVAEINSSIQAARSTSTEVGEKNDQLALIAKALYRIHSHRICWLPAAAVICLAAGVPLFSSAGELSPDVRDLYESSLRANETLQPHRLLGKAASRIAHLPASDLHRLLEQALQILVGTDGCEPVEDVAWLALKDTWKFVLPLRVGFAAATRAVHDLLQQSILVRDMPTHCETFSDHAQSVTSIPRGPTGRKVLANKLLTAGTPSPLRQLQFSVNTWLTKFATQHLARVDSLPFNEIFVAPAWSHVRPYVSASPVAEFFKELTHPCEVMGGTCCSAAESKLEPSNEDISLTFRSLKACLSESSKPVAQQTWYEAFRSAFAKQLAECQARDQLRRNAHASKPQPKRLRTNAEAPEESVEALELDIQQRFTSAVQQCEFLGIVKSLSGKEEPAYEAVSLDPKAFWGV